MAERVDKAEVDNAGTSSLQSSIVVEQFVWEVGETLDLIRNVTMSGSHIDGMTVAEIISTCTDSLLEMGSALELRSFLAAVRDLAEVLHLPEADGSLIDKHIDAVALQSRLVPPLTEPVAGRRE